MKLMMKNKDHLVIPVGVSYMMVKENEVFEIDDAEAYSLLSKFGGLIFRVEEQVNKQIDKIERIK